jgi:AcrR family transcriptional regulator
MSLRDLKKQRVRTSILSAAAELIDRVGYTEARMRDIAASTGISYQTLYNYFPTKARLLQELLAEDVARTAARIDELIDGYSPGTLLATMHAINRTRMGAVAATNRTLWREIVIALFEQDPQANSLYQTVDAISHAKLAAILGRARTRGELPPGADISLFAHTVYALSEFAFVEYVMQPDADREETLHRLEAQVELLLAPYLSTH